jgi:type IV pilus assembly protein PilW
MRHSTIRNKKGFTLTEIIVSMGIGMVVLAAVTTTFMSQARYYNAQEQVNEMEQNARGALDVITRELKMAGYNPASGTITGVTYSTSQLQIEADLDSSGTISTTSTANERIIYAFDSANNQITRKVGSGSTQVLAENITAFDFTYYKADGITTTTTSSEIRQVKIDITARTSKPDPNYSSNGGYRTYQIFNTITPINLAL